MTLDKHIRHELPKSWSWKALGDICAITDRDHRTPVYVERGVPLISPRDFTENGIDLSNLKQVEESEHTAFVKKCKPEKWDVLYSRIGTIGEARLLDFDFDFVALHSIALIKPTEEGLSPRFLLYLLQTPEVRAQAKHNIKSVGTPDLGLQRIRNFGVPVPPPKEQQQIVAEIEKQFTRLEAGVAALRRVQANLKRYRAAVLKAACEGKLVPTEAELSRSQPSTKNSQPAYEPASKLLARILAERRKNWTGRGKYKEPAAPDMANLPEIPDDWTWASVDQLAAETMIGLDRGRAQQSDDPSSGVPYIKMNNVTMDGRVFYDDMAYVPADKAESERFAVQDGDILFNTRNSKELVGKVGIVRNAPDGAIYNNNLMRIRVAAGVASAFLCLQMCSHEFRRRMELVKKATTNVAAVYAKDLLPLPIALPPLAEQTRIVAEVERRLSVVEELESVVSANLQRATRLRQSILQKAFTGEL